MNAIYFKYHSKTKLLNAPNPYLDFLIDTSFQGVDMISVLLLDPNDNRIGHLICYLPIAKVKDYNVTIEGKKITTGQGDDYTTSCLLDYNYSIKHYKMTAIGLSKHQALDFNPKAIRPINLLEI